jgi:hypothetical protein
MLNDEIKESGMTVTVDTGGQLDQTINAKQGGKRRFAIGVSTESQAQTVELECVGTNGHALVVEHDPAAAGTVALLGSVIEQQVLAGGAVVIFDSSGNPGLLDTLYGSAMRAHRTPDFFSVSPYRPYESNTYNAILANAPYVVAEQVVRLIGSEAKTDDGFHLIAAKDAVSVLVAALRKLDLAYSLLDLALFLLHPDLVLELLASMRDRFGSAGETTNLSDWVGAFMTTPGNVDRTEYRQVLGELAGKLYLVAAGKAGTVLNAYRPEVVFQTMLSDRRLVHFDLPGGVDHQVATTIRQMVYVDLREAMRNRPGGDSSLLLIFNGADAMDGEIARMMRSRSLSDVSAWFAGGIKADRTDFAANDPIMLMGHAVSEIQFAGSHGKGEFVLRTPAGPVQTVRLNATVQDDGQTHRFSRRALNRDVDTQPDGASQFTRTVVATTVENVGDQG